MSILLVQPVCQLIVQIMCHHQKNLKKVAKISQKQGHILLQEDYWSHHPLHMMKWCHQLSLVHVWEGQHIRLLQSMNITVLMNMRQTVRLTKNHQHQM